MKFIKYIITGILFGIIMSKSEAISWYRIQEMFRFQSFHMFGIIGKMRRDKHEQAELDTQG